MAETDPRGVAYSQAYSVTEAPRVIPEAHGFTTMELPVSSLEIAAEPHYVSSTPKVFQKIFRQPVGEMPLSAFPVVPISYLDTENPEAYFLERGKKAWDFRNKVLVSYQTSGQDPQDPIVSFPPASPYR